MYNLRKQQLLKKTSRASLTKKLYGSQAGQALVEYVLILVVVVGLILGVMLQFSDAFRNWGNNYFGEYLACLLETGELPSIGGQGSAGTCNELFEPFSMASGRPLLNPPTSSGGGQSQAGAPSGATEGKAPNQNSIRVAGSAYRGGSSGRFNGGSLGGAGGGGNQGATLSKQAERVYTGSTANSMPGQLGGNSAGGSSQRGSRETPIPLGGFAKDKQEEKNPEARIPVATAKDERGGKQKKIPYMRKTASISSEEPEVAMTFGSYFRFLLIAAILVAIIVFIGGQIMQFSKSRE